MSTDGRVRVGEIYEWEQTRDDLTIFANVPAGTTAQHVSCAIRAKGLKLEVASATVLQGEFEAAVDTDSSTWTFGDAAHSVVEITLDKRQSGKRWASALVGHGDLVAGGMSTADDRRQFAELERQVEDLGQKLGELDAPGTDDGADASDEETDRSSSQDAAAAAEAEAEVVVDPRAHFTGGGRVLERQSRAAGPLPSALPPLANVSQLTAAWAEAALGHCRSRFVSAVELSDVCGPNGGSDATVRFAYGDHDSAAPAATAAAERVAGPEGDAALSSEHDTQKELADLPHLNPLVARLQLLENAGARTNAWAGDAGMGHLPTSSMGGVPVESACYSNFFGDVDEGAVPFLYADIEPQQTAGSGSGGAPRALLLEHVDRSATPEPSAVLLALAKLHGRASAHASSASANWLPPLQFTERAQDLVSGIEKNSSAVVRACAQAHNGGGVSAAESTRGFVTLATEACRDGASAIKNAVLALATTASPTLVHGALGARTVVARCSGTADNDSAQETAMANAIAEGERAAADMVEDAAGAAAELRQLAGPRAAQGLDEKSGASAGSDDRSTTQVGAVPHGSPAIVQWGSASWGCGLFDVACYIASLSPAAQRRVWPGLLERYCGARNEANDAASRIAATTKSADASVEPVGGAALSAPLSLDQAKKDWHLCQLMLFACVCSLDWVASAEADAGGARAEHLRRIAHCIDFCEPESGAAEVKPVAEAKSEG